MPISVLGVTELCADDGAALHVGGLRRRAGLAVLALELNRVVPVERLLGIVWDDRPPPRARAAFQGHVAVLRRLLPPSLRLETQAIGYRLVGSSESVDSLRFADLVERAARTEDAAAARLLDTALGLWRGEPLADLNSLRYFRSMSDGLARAREHALEAWAWRRLRLGEGVGAISALHTALRGDPVSEPLIAMLMMCLAQGGRQAEAVEAFHDARERLGSEYGTRPGPQLQEALARILRGPDGFAPLPGGGVHDARPGMERPVPRQLPRPQYGFTGRVAELAGLAPLEADPVPGSPSGARLAIVSGAAGVGKTALILHWAHHAAERFPDGQLYADLRGVLPDGPADPVAVLAGFLRALGVDGARIPSDLRGAAALFRERTRDLRLLIVLDNVGDAGQVLALLPDGPACVTVVASRFVLVDLAVDRGAALCLLPPLTAPDALAVLESAVDPSRLREDPAATARLIDLCDRLPLALRLAASGLALRPSWSVAHLVDDPETEYGFLEVLDQGRAYGVSAALDATRRRLAPDAARLLVLLGLYPGTDIDPYAAGALLGSGFEGASSALMNLAAWNLVLDAVPGRYAWPGLVGMYARRLLIEEIEPTVARTALARLASYFAHAAASAANLAPAGLPLYNGQLPRWHSASEAVAWLKGHDQVLHDLAAEADRSSLRAERDALDAILMSAERTRSVVA